ncbi:unnamed protein product [Mucor hiemalis]
MILQGRRKSSVADEENGLCVQPTPPTTTNYGAIPTGAPSGDETSSLRGNSDADERASNHSSSSNVVKRKKRRMEQRQCCRPRVATRFSSILHKKNSSDSEEEDERPYDLVLPALDPK